jgi:hypothetical protein
MHSQQVRNSPVVKQLSAVLVAPGSRAREILNGPAIWRTIMIIAKCNKRDFTPAPEGLQSAVCCDVLDLGVQQTPWGDSHKVEIRWQLEDRDPKSGKPFMVVQRYTLSLHEKSRLRPMLEAWRGQKFRAEELEGFDLERLIGVNCQIQIIHNIKDGGEVYANVQAVVPPAKGAPKVSISADYIKVAERERRADFGRSAIGADINDEAIPF